MLRIYFSLFFMIHLKEFWTSCVTDNDIFTNPRKWLYLLLINQSSLHLVSVSCPFNHHFNIYLQILFARWIVSAFIHNWGQNSAFTPMISICITEVSLYTNLCCFHYVGYNSSCLLFARFCILWYKSFRITLKSVLGTPVGYAIACINVLYYNKVYIITECNTNTSYN